MDTSYELREIKIDPQHLLLDPNNPRLHQNAKVNKKLEVSELCDANLQSRVSKALHDKEHAVKRLVDSIKENGFVNIDSIFVKALPSVGKYLVLEGNRRTSAIKEILSKPAGVKPSSLASLEKIPVKELICDDDLFEAQMTDFILSIRHIFGVKDWAPMQKAHAIHSSYMRHLVNEEKIDRFRYIKPIADSVGKAMNLKSDEIRKALGIYRVYSQLQSSGYEAKSDHYSLIEMCLKRPKMAVELFGFDNTSFQFSHSGVALFDALCIESGCEVTNPVKFRKLYTVWKDGSSREIKLVARGGLSIEEAEKGAKATSVQRDATRKLAAALDQLKKIELGTLQGTAKEKELVIQIQEIIREKILPTILD